MIELKGKLVIQFRITGRTVYFQKDWKLVYIQTLTEIDITL